MPHTGSTDQASKPDVGKEEWEEHPHAAAEEARGSDHAPGDKVWFSPCKENYESRREAAQDHRDRENEKSATESVRQYGPEACPDQKGGGRQRKRKARQFRSPTPLF